MNSDDDDDDDDNVAHRAKMGLTNLDVVEVEIKVFARSFEQRVGRYHAPLQHDDGFEDAGKTTDAFQVANIGLDGAPVDVDQESLAHWLATRDGNTTRLETD